MAITESGIDPERVTKLVDEVVKLRSDMQEMLREISTDIYRGVHENYQGQAATALLDKIRNEMPALIEFLNSYIRELVTNINDDIRDAKLTDQKLATQM